MDNNYSYKGGIRNKKKVGYGIEITNDHEYKGNFLNDQKKGEGEITILKTNDKFVGEFKDNKMFHGAFTWKVNNNVYNGFFENNKMHGEGTYTYSSGNQNMFIGNYKNGKKHGHGIIKENGKEIYKGEFIEGTPHGKGFRYDKNGDKIEIEMDKGKVTKNKENSSAGISKNKSAAKIGLSNYFLFF